MRQKLALLGLLLIKIQNEQLNTPIQVFFFCFFNASY